MDGTVSSQNVSSSKLLYTIHGCSSFSATYNPENILYDKPKDQTSRWSSETNTPPQFLVLKLQRVSIVEKILFGKFEKTHVCNLKKFKIFGGLTEDKMSELLESGLRNDSTPETFFLKLEMNGHPFPCQYIKIIPLQSWGPSFNFSIWYIELRGMDDYRIVQPCISRFTAFRQEEAVRVCLKHLRDYNYHEAFESLQKKTKIQLEHPLVSELHEMLVEHGDYIAAERFMHRCAEAKLFQRFISRQDYKAKWSLIPNNCGEIPTPRGGHQCVIDSSRKSLYLFGGWDGCHDLADFWVYEISSNKWSQISANTEQEGGPSPRSCHKMCFDPNQSRIYTLGYFFEPYNKLQCEMKSDFYAYDIGGNFWTRISQDTASEGGPQLIFDHQVCLDERKHSIYVFGGQILTGTERMTGILTPAQISAAESEDGNWPHENNPAGRTGRNLLPIPRPAEEVQVIGEANMEALNISSSPPQEVEILYSGLFCYNISTNTWVQLRCDIMSPKQGCKSLRSRVGHSMLLHPGLRKLYIFSGQRSKEYLNDFFSYDIDTDEVEILSDGSQDSNRDQNFPALGFSQRVTIDPEQNEIHVFSGLSKDGKEKDKREDAVQNSSFWVFHITRRTWSCIYRNDIFEDHNWFRVQQVEPCPRYAHQLVYDYESKTHFLFGGNPGRNKDGILRLDDFWKLNLVRPGLEDILYQCKLMLRTLHFEELARKNSICALTYLQTDLAELINKEDPNQSKQFQRLTLHLFSNATKESDTWLISSDGDGSREQIFKRSKLFDKLARFFPAEMTQPKLNLIDLVSI